MAQITVTIDFGRELGPQINALKTLADALGKNAELEQPCKPSADPTPHDASVKSTAGKPKPQADPKPDAEAVTLADVRAVAMELSKANKSKLQQILVKYGGPPLTKVAPDNLAKVLAEIQGALNG